MHETDRDASSRLPALRDEVRAFRLGSFHLDHDLGALHAVRRVGASEAVVFYGGRILEALAAAAVERLGLEPPPNPFSCLLTLDDLGLLGIVDGYVGHALRRLGNGVRHIGWQPDPDDADVVVAFARAWIGWYFVRYPLGPGLGSVASETKDTVGGRPGLILAWLDQLERFVQEGGGAPPKPPEALVEADVDLGPGQVALLCVAIEACIGQRHHEHAERMLDLGLAHAPDDVRLLQLAALLRSRRGDVDGAIGILEPLRRRRADDPETVGILAGALKRRAGDDPTSPDLARAHRLYRQGWKVSRGYSTYLGINAAATALILGDVEGARTVALAVRERLDRRGTALEAVGAGRLPLPYWQAVTRAEALLIEGRTDEAVLAYRDAFARHALRRDDRTSTVAQADAILRRLGLAQGLEDRLR